MTKRVIQTDLFAAFKDSQRRAEEQVGQKRKLKVEGSTVRKIENHTEKGERGLELIHSRPVEQETPTTETPSATAAPATAPVQEEERTPTPAPTAPRPTVSYQTVNEQRVAATAERKTVERERPELKPAAPAAAAVTTPKPVVPETPAQAIQVRTPPATTPATSSGDDGGTLLKWATVVLLVAAAFIVGQRMGEEKAAGQTQIVYLPAEPEPNDDDLDEPDPALAVPVNNTDETTLDPVTGLPISETNTDTETDPTDETDTTVETPIEPVVEVTPPAPLGNKTVLVVSGISKRQAEKVAELIRASSEYEVYIRNDAVYVGRFSGFFKSDINDCQKFCRDLEFEGRKQFKDAFQIKLPGALITEAP